MYAKKFGATVLKKLDEEHSGANSFHEFFLPVLICLFLHLSCPSRIQVLCKHLPRIVDFDCSISFLRKSLNDEISDGKEELLVSFDLSVVLAPFSKN